MPTITKPAHNGDLYDRDPIAWARRQADLLRAGHWQAVDLDHLIAELDGVGRSDWRAAQSYLALVLEHLLKLAVSPAEAPRREWRQAVIRHRIALSDQLEETPSLKARLDLVKAYALAARTARAGLADHDGPAVADRVPQDCPVTLAQALDMAWWPTTVGKGGQP